MSSRRRIKISQELLDKEFVSAEEKARSLQTAIFHVGKKNTFIGSTLQCLNIMYTHIIPTAGITFNPENRRWDMYINPYFFCSRLTDLNREAILMHEISHVLHKHPIRVPFIKMAPRKRMLMNIAADMVINQNIPNLPNGCDKCPPPEQGKRCENEKCPGKCIMVEDYYDVDDKANKQFWAKNQTMEQYYEKLLTRFRDPDESQESQGDAQQGGSTKGGKGNKPGKGKGKSGDKGDNEANAQGNAGGGAETDDLPQTIDEHMWDGSAEEKDLLEATEELVKRAMVKARLDFENLPGAIKDLLREIEARKAELNYRALILAAIKRSASGHDRRSTWSRPSKRYGEKAAGTKIGDLPKLAMYLDTSGSISIEELNEFIIIVENFLRVGSRKCNIAFFHTDMYGKRPFKLGERIKREDIQSGGTDLTKVLEDIKKTRPDLGIIITDGAYSNVDFESWLKPGEKFPQVLWIISKQGEEKHPISHLGQTVKVPNSEKMGK